MLTQDHLTLRLVRLDCPQEWVDAGRAFSFILPNAGEGKYLSGSTAHPLRAGDVLVLDGSGAAKISVPNGGEMVFWSFDVTFEHLFPLFATSEICLLQNVVDRFKGSRMYPASSALAGECHRLIAAVPPQFNLDHRSQLLRVVAAILSVEFKTVQGDRVGYIRAEEHMIQVFEKLSVNELLGLSVGELADKFSCSRRHLNRLFHQHFGYSVAALRMEMRLLKAISLLRDPSAKVIIVAEQCGFNHLGLFNTCFKRRFGSSPGQWRKLYSAEADRRNGLQLGPQECPLHTNGLCPWTGQPDNANPSIGNPSQNGQANRPPPVVKIQILSPGDDRQSAPRRSSIAQTLQNGLHTQSARTGRP